MIEHIEQGTLPSHVKACIALTSWKKRINTVGLTIYNLFETCGPDYHIVLTLAEEEFPRKEQELPRDLVLMTKAGVFEILWCKSNVRSFKKWLFCAAKYPKVPVITADDDCLYLYNYANELYNTWTENKRKVITETSGCNMWGYATLYPPNLPLEWSRINDIIKDCLSINLTHDDLFMTFYLYAKGIQIKSLHKPMNWVAVTHSTIDSLGTGRALLKTLGLDDQYIMHNIFMHNGIKNIPNALPQIM